MASPRNSSDEDCTATPSFRSSSPTTPATILSPTDQALLVVQQICSGTYQNSSDSFYITLTSDEYAVFKAEIENDPKLHSWAIDKLRTDWTAKTGELVIHMATTMRDIAATETEDTVIKHVNKLASEAPADSAIPTIAANIAPRYTSRVDLPGLGPGSYKSPDASTRYKGYKFPPITLEVAYSHDKSRVEKKVNEYVLGSNGDIKAIIGISWRTRIRTRPQAKELAPAT